MFAAAKQWWSEPYQERMSAPKWFLFFGFVIIAGIIWSMIIKTLTD